MRAAVVVLSAAIFSATAPIGAENWPQWRGPLLNGLSRETNLPVRWSKTDGLAWTLPLPAWSGSTPIVWGDRIFLNVAEGPGVFLWSIDRTKGTALWKRQISGGNKQIRKQNMSTPSPVTDGTGVWVITGTGVLKAFDFDGNEKWMRDIQRDYGIFGQLYGYGSSPLLFENFRTCRSFTDRTPTPLASADQQGRWQNDLANGTARRRAGIAGRLHDADAVALRNRDGNRRAGAMS
jgi:hypothetical protein